MIEAMETLRITDAQTCLLGTRGDVDSYPEGIALGTDEERVWAAEVMSGTDPWITLGRTYEQCLQAMHDPSYQLFIAHDAAGSPAAFCLLHPTGAMGSPYIRALAVRPDLRGAGFGTRMLEFIDREVAANARRLFLCVSSFNVSARRLYERFGFTVAGELKGYVIPGASEILMEKKPGVLIK